MSCCRLGVQMINYRDRHRVPQEDREGLLVSRGMNSVKSETAEESRN